MPKTLTLIASPNAPFARKAFTLMELLIVIFILSLFVYLSGKISFFTKKKEKLTVSTLRHILQTKVNRGDEGVLLCTDQCQHCFIKTSFEAPFKPISLPILLKVGSVYTLDKNNHLRRIEYAGSLKGKPICLKMRVYTNGSVEPLIVQTPKGFFYIPSFFGEVQHFKRLQEARNAWLKSNEQLKREGLF